MTEDAIPPLVDEPPLHIGYIITRGRTADMTITVNGLWQEGFSELAIFEGKGLTVTEINERNYAMLGLFKKRFVAMQYACLPPL